MARVRAQQRGGAVLVLVALLLFVLFGVIAIVVDLSIAGSAAEQTRFIARVVALGAIEEYYDTVDTEAICSGVPTSADRHEHAMCFARSRAEELAEQFDLFAGQDSDVPIISLTAEDDSVWLSPGIWYTAAHPLCLVDPQSTNPPDLTNCPCGTSEEDLPCFVSLEDHPDGAPLPNRPSAMRATGVFFPSLTMQLARNLFGVESISLSAEAISSIVPRRGCFLIDVSPSVTFVTHRRLDLGIPRDVVDDDGNYQSDGNYQNPCECTPGLPCICDSGPNPAEAFGNKYAYILQQENAAFTAYDQRQDCPWYWLNNICPTDSTCDNTILFPTDPVGLAQQCGFFQFPGEPQTFLFLDRFQFADARERPPGESYNPQKHYASDYRRFYTFGDEDYAASANTPVGERFKQYHPDPASFSDRYEVGFPGQWVNVDVFEDGNGRGPEPLTTIMAGLNTAMQEFEERQIAGDQACIVFFDRNTPWFRVLRMTNDFQYLREFTDFSLPWSGTPGPAYASDAEYESPVRVEGGDWTQEFSGIRQAVYSDLNAYQQRLRLIRHGVFPFRGSASDFRVGIGEGLDQLLQSRRDGVASSDFLVMITDGLHNCSGNPASCPFTYAGYEAAMLELKETFLQAIETSGNRTPLHFILTGDHVGPHTVSLTETTGQPAETPPDGERVEGSNGNCFTDFEYRETENATQFEFVRGIPIQERESAFDDLDVPFYQVNKDLYEVAVVTQGLWGPLRPRNGSFCDSLTLPDGSPVGEEGFSPQEYRPLCGEQSDSQNVVDVDGENRRLTDPYCRSETVQIQQYMREIIGQNPFNIVQLR